MDKLKVVHRTYLGYWQVASEPILVSFLSIGSVEYIHISLRERESEREQTEGNNTLRGKASAY